MNAGRGSRPGFSSSLRMSTTVGRPKRESAYFAGSIFCSTGRWPITSRMPSAISASIFSTSGYASGCTADASSGFAPSAIRRKPAACSNARSPSRLTLSSSTRLANAPFASRCSTMFCARLSDNPAIRASSSGTLAVLTSTPTPFTQSSITSFSDRASRDWLTSCWYWPTPIAFGSILTSSASGSCRRRAIDTAPRRLTSRSGNSFAASADAEYTDAPASETDTRVSRGSGCRAINSPTSRSVSREPVPLPIATSSTACVFASVARVAIEPSMSLRGACG